MSGLKRTFLFSALSGLTFLGISVWVLGLSSDQLLYYAVAAFAGMVIGIAGSSFVAAFQEGKKVSDNTEDILDKRFKTWNANLPFDPKKHSLSRKLLVARHAIVPRFGRDDKIADVEAWCLRDEALSLWVVQGEGGVGKTRLYLEVMDLINTGKLRLKGNWQAAFLRDHATKRPGFAREFREILQLGHHFLIVVDYAETRPDEVRQLVEVLHDNAAGRRLRVVLICRRVSDWWQHLKAAVPEQMGQIFDLAPIKSHSALALPENERYSAFEQAIEAFKKKNLPIKQTDLAQPKLEKKHFERMLFIHIAALAWMDGQILENDGDLLQFVQQRERDVIQRKANSRGLDVETHASRLACLERAVALATLHGEIDDYEFLKQSMIILGEHTDIPNHLESAIEVLVDLYGEREQKRFSRLRGLEPDLIGEFWIEQVLATDEGQRVLEAAFSPQASERGVKQGITVLARIVRRNPAASAWLALAFAQDLTRLGRIGIEVALQEALPENDPSLSDPLGLALAQAFESTQNVEAAKALHSAFPLETVCLREAATATRQILLNHAKRTNNLEEAALYANNLAVRLGALGEPEKALDASLEAVEIYKELAQKRPDAFKPDLAMSLNNLSNRYSELGQREKALDASLEAVEIYKELAQKRPDAFKPDLASSLNNLSVFYSELGQREKALEAILEAVEIYKELAQKRPDAFKPNLASSLNNLSGCYSELGKREKALDAILEAVEIRKELAENRPDAFKPDLASSLNNLSNRYSELGQREKALEAILEAVEIYKELAQKRPDAFKPNLASSLNNLSNCYSELGKREKALEASLEAVEIRRELAQKRPDAFKPDLASSLNNLSARYSELGKREKALDAILEAVEIRKELAENRPDAFKPDLASSLNNLSARLTDVDRHQEAMDASLEAIDIRRELAQKYPDAFNPDLATSLFNISIDFEQFNRPEEAHDACKESLQIISPYFLALPQAYSNWIVDPLNRYLKLCNAIHRQPDVELIGPIIQKLIEIGAIEAPEESA